MIANNYPSMEQNISCDNCTTGVKLGIKQVQVDEELKRRKEMGFTF